MGHGVRHSFFEEAVGVQVAYDDETPMSYCEVKVFSPLDAETEYQESFTDKNGRFAFCPDTTGTWHIVIDDGMGHGMSEEIEVEEGMQVLKKDIPEFSRLRGGVIGVVLIVLIFSAVCLFTPWQSNRAGIAR